MWDYEHFIQHFIIKNPTNHYESRQQLNIKAACCKSMIKIPIIMAIKFNFLNSRMSVIVD